eukprot:TRINITY_DN9741_c0_g1_i1.p1 TRINITY_DN9741_c0_g1~~TRINITY_DN9741_c0_g1_i1.p1  ORF type:complete len:663 (-),score=135.93 TRINITY_DN9741_c0_g1_i1:35-1993(-)
MAESAVLLDVIQPERRPLEVTTAGGISGDLKATSPAETTRRSPRMQCSDSTPRTIENRPQFSVGKHLQPSGDFGRPSWEDACAENRCKESTTVQAKPQGHFNKKVVNSAWEKDGGASPPRDMIPAGNDICEWLASTLRFQRLSVETMLVRQHEAILQHMRLTIDFQNNETVVPVISAENESYESSAMSLGEVTRHDKKHDSEQNIFSEPTHASSKKTAREELSKRPSVHTIANEVASHAQSLDQHLKMERGKCRASAIDNLRSTFGGDMSNSARTVASIFEICIAGVITLNVLIMSLERQYQGFDVGYYVIGYRGYRPAEETWPGGASFFVIAEWVIGCLFTLEVIVMLCVLRLRFFRSLWHLFDLMVVAFWLLLVLEGGSNVFIDPMLLRIAKLMRLVRLARVLRFAAVFDALHLIMKSVSSSMAVLFWSLLLLLLLIVVTSLCVSQAVDSWIRDDTNVAEEREAVFEHWGTLTRSVETMFEVTLGNWGPPCRLLQNRIHDAWMLFFVAYKCIIGFAVVQVITSVFIQQTFKVVARDEQVMINERKAASESCLKHMEHLFEVIDVTEDGYLSQEELAVCLADVRVKSWFQALEIDISEASVLFNLIDDGDGLISRKEFIDGVKGLRGVARSIDIKSILKEIRILQTLLVKK